MVELGQFNTIFESIGDVAAERKAENVASGVEKISSGWSKGLSKMEEMRGRAEDIGAIAGSIAGAVGLNIGEASETEQTGIAVGALVGGIGGAILGSFVPGVGTIIGEVVGSVAGGFIGRFVAPLVSDLITSIKDYIGFNEAEKNRERITSTQRIDEIISKSDRDIASLEAEISKLEAKPLETQPIVCRLISSLRGDIDDINSQTRNRLNEILNGDPNVRNASRFAQTQLGLTDTSFTSPGAGQFGDFGALGLNQPFASQVPDFVNGLENATTFRGLSLMANDMMVDISNLFDITRQWWRR